MALQGKIFIDFHPLVYSEPFWAVFVTTVIPFITLSYEGNISGDKNNPLEIPQKTRLTQTKTNDLLAVYRFKLFFLDFESKIKQLKLLAVCETGRDPLTKAVLGFTSAVKRFERFLRLYGEKIT